MGEIWHRRIVAATGQMAGGTALGCSQGASQRVLAPMCARRREIIDRPRSKSARRYATRTSGSRVLLKRRVRPRQCLDADASSERAARKGHYDTKTTSSAKATTPTLAITSAGTGSSRVVEMSLVSIMRMGGDPLGYKPAHSSVIEIRPANHMNPLGDITPVAQQLPPRDENVAVA